jgi:hypothetical protein
MSDPSQNRMQNRHVGDLIFAQVCFAGFTAFSFWYSARFWLFKYRDSNQLYNSLPIWGAVTVTVIWAIYILVNRHLPSLAGHVVYICSILIITVHVSCYGLLLLGQ